MASGTQAPGGRTGADFISISSSDDDLPTPKRRRSIKSASASPPGNGVADKASPKTSSDRAHKRARLLSSSAGSSGSDARSETRVSREEGEVGDNEDAASHDAKNQARAEEDDDADTAAEKSTEGASGVFVPQDPPLFAQDSLSLRLPVFSQKREGSWHTRFQDWVQLLLTSNHEHAAALTPSLVHTAYKQYIDCHSGLKQAKRRGAKETSAKLEARGELAKMLETLRSSIGSPQHEGASAGTPSQAKASDEPVLIDQADQARQASDESRANSANKTGAAAKKTETTITDVIILSSDGPQDSAEVAPPVPSSPPRTNGLKEPAMAHRKGVPLGADALAQQRRYFPSAVDPARMCLLCGREGHIAIECRDSVCRFCSKDDHWDFVCPTIPTRCGKCHQLGHSTAKCIEKLALTKDEGLECFYCKSPDHLEDECTEWWRSYEPLAHVVKTISHLPSSCAACGSGQHYSGDCPQRRRSGPANPTWTSRNCNMYIDPASSSSAIEESYSQVGKPRASHQPDLRIRGSAAPRTHIQYESEDSDVEFLGQRASARKPKIGQIRVSSNIQMPNENVGHYSSLPLAPPRTTTSSFPAPPGTRGNASYSLPTGPPPSLPSRPPVRTFHGVPPPASLSNNARGGFGGGRGGGRGRGGRGGRGRGRGK